MQGIEHIVSSSMVGLFWNNNILTIAQHVFHKIVTLVIIHHYHQWAWLKMSKRFQSRHYPPIISLDTHRRTYCIIYNTTTSTPQPKKWITSFIQNRKTSVRLWHTVCTLVWGLPDISQLQNTVSDLYQRHTKNSNFIWDKCICLLFRSIITRLRATCPTKI
jgi:hypothetical protein